MAIKKNKKDANSLSSRLALGTSLHELCTHWCC